MSNHHHNPLDPRDPVGAFVWYNIVTGDDDDRGRRGGRGPNDTPGCGCLFLLILAAAMAVFIIAGH